MHGNGERDPLDGWLTQQVQPLPPPPGTFELITRRARRRKLRKVAVTAVSAAAVAVAVAVAVPGGLVLRLSPTPVTGQAVARGSTPPSIGGTNRVNGTGTKMASPTPTVTTPAPSITASAPVTTPGGPVPDNFQPASITFVSTTKAWVIGQAGTPGKCANADPYICTSIVRTDNAGQHWAGGPAPMTGAPANAAGVSAIRFLDGVNGWAFGPELWATHDAGNSWHPVPAADGFRVTDLETVHHRAYALFATCSGASLNFAAHCTRYTLMTVAADSDNWRPVGGATSDLTAGGADTSAVLALTDEKGYLIAPDGTLYSGPIGGQWAKAGTVNCQPGPAQANGLPSRALFAVQNSAQLAVACMGPSFSGVTVYTSSDGGNLFAQQPASAWSGVTQPATATSLTAALNGTLVLATSTGIDVFPAGGSGWKQAAMGSPGAPAGGFTYVGMTDSDQGVAIPADGMLHEIWMTKDGGDSWAPVTKILPGS